MKLHYTKPKYYTMLNAVIVKALVDRLASTGLILYVQSSSEDLKLATGTMPLSWLLVMLSLRSSFCRWKAALTASL